MWSGSEEVGLDGTDRKTQLFLIYRVSITLKMLVYNLRLEIQGKSFVQVYYKTFQLHKPKMCKGSHNQIDIAVTTTLSGSSCWPFFAIIKLKNFIKINNVVKKIGMFFPKF